MSVNNEIVLSTAFQITSSEPNFISPFNMTSIKAEDDNDIYIKEEPLKEVKMDVNYEDNINGIKERLESQIETVLIQMDPLILEECEGKLVNSTVSDAKEQAKDPTMIFEVLSKSLVDNQQNKQENISTIVNLKCRKCKQKFKYKDSFLSHLSSVHGINSSFICEYCGKTFTKKKSFDIHKKKIHNEGLRVITCNECNKSYMSKSALIEHLNTIHAKEKAYSCHLCEKSFSRYRLLSKHSKMHQEKNFTCDVCKKKFRYKIALKIHFTVVHEGVKKYTCYLCDVKFGYNSALKRHMRNMHQPAENVKEACMICKKLFHKSYIKEHIKAVHEGYRPNKRYSCDKCNQKYVHKNGLLRHTCPSQKELYACNHCEKSDQKKEHLVQNIIGHNTQPCDKCNKEFKMKWMFNKHKKDAHKSLMITYICSICNKNYKSQSYLRRHLKNVHNNSIQGVNNLSQSLEYVRKKLLLKGHIVNDHNKNQIRYTCDLCEKRFKTKKYVKAHITYVHQQKKLFACNICDKLFYQLIHLKEHMKLEHNEILKYPCSLCDKSFSFQQSVCRHMKNFHHVTRWQWYKEAMHN